MAKAYIIKEHGGIDKLQIQNIDLPPLGDEEVLIKHTAIGINFDDIQVRQGFYHLKDLPIIPGCEGIGYIEKVGAKVTAYKVGMRACYILPSQGAYATHRAIHQNYIMIIDERYNSNILMGCLRKGVTAHFLTRRTFYIRKGHKVLVYGAAGGVSSILCQLANHYGATVIGVVSNAEKISYARDLGCKYVINSAEQDVVGEVQKITNNEGVEVVYDLAGGNLEASLAAVGELGLLVNYGDCSGTAPALDISLLSKKSNFLTRPRIYHYEKYRYEFILSMNEILTALDRNIINVTLTEYKFEQIPEIHSAMEARKTIGANVVVF